MEDSEEMEDSSIDSLLSDVSLDEVWDLTSEEEEEKDSKEESKKDDKEEESEKEKETEEEHEVKEKEEPKVELVTDNQGEAVKTTASVSPDTKAKEESVVKREEEEKMNEKEDEKENEKENVKENEKENLKEEDESDFSDVLSDVLSGLSISQTTTSNRSSLTSQRKLSEISKNSSSEEKKRGIEKPSASTSGVDTLLEGKETKEKEVERGLPAADIPDTMVRASSGAAPPSTKIPPSGTETSRGIEEKTKEVHKEKGALSPNMNNKGVPGPAITTSPHKKHDTLGDKLLPPSSSNISRSDYESMQVASPKRMSNTSDVSSIASVESREPRYSRGMSFFTTLETSLIPMMKKASVFSQGTIDEDEDESATGSITSVESHASTAPSPSLNGSSPTAAPLRKLLSARRLEAIDNEPEESDMSVCLSPRRQKAIKREEEQEEEDWKRRKSEIRASSISSPPPPSSRRKFSVVLTSTDRENSLLCESPSGFHSNSSSGGSDGSPRHLRKNSQNHSSKGSTKIASTHLQRILSGSKLKKRSGSDSEYSSDSEGGIHIARAESNRSGESESGSGEDTNSSMTKQRSWRTVKRNTAHRVAMQGRGSGKASSESDTAGSHKSSSRRSSKRVSTRRKSQTRRSGVSKRRGSGRSQSRRESSRKRSSALKKKQEGELTNTVEDLMCVEPSSHGVRADASSRTAEKGGERISANKKLIPTPPEGPRPTDRREARRSYEARSEPAGYNRQGPSSPSGPASDILPLATEEKYLDGHRYPPSNISTAPQSGGGLDSYHAWHSSAPPSSAHMYPPPVYSPEDQRLREYAREAAREEKEGELMYRIQQSNRERNKHASLLGLSSKNYHQRQEDELGSHRRWVPFSREGNYDSNHLSSYVHGPPTTTSRRSSKTKTSGKGKGKGKRKTPKRACIAYAMVLDLEEITKSLELELQASVAHMRYRAWMDVNHS